MGSGQLAIMKCAIGLSECFGCEYHHHCSERCGFFANRSISSTTMKGMNIFAESVSSTAMGSMVAVALAESIINTKVA